MSGGPAQAMLEVVTALLRQGRTIDHLSRLLTVAALVMLIGAIAFGVASKPLMAALAFAVLAGAAETYFAFRVGFDADLFDRLREPARLDLAALDAALMQLGLAPASKSGRPLDQRIAGAQRLLYKQGLALVIQMAVLLCGAAVALVA